MIPRVKPPRTAPTKLSIPPITAATKPKTKSRLNSKDSGEIDPEPFVVCKIPAVAPAAPEIAQPTVRIKSTRMPARRDISGANDEARSDKPQLVRWKIKVKTTIKTTTVPRISKRIGESAMLSPETMNPLSESGGVITPIRSP